MPRHANSRVFTTAVAAAALLFASGCGDDARQNAAAAPAATAPATAASNGTATPRSAGGTRRLARSRSGVRVSTIAGGLEIPWDLASFPTAAP